MEEEERRNVKKAVPEDLPDFLSQQQIFAYHGMERFGWYIKFIRRPLFQRPAGNVPSGPPEVSSEAPAYRLDPGHQGKKCIVHTILSQGMVIREAKTIGGKVGPMAPFKLFPSALPFSRREGVEPSPIR